MTFNTNLCLIQKSIVFVEFQYWNSHSAHHCVMSSVMCLRYNKKNTQTLNLSHGADHVFFHFGLSKSSSEELKLIFKFSEAAGSAGLQSCPSDLSRKTWSSVWKPSESQMSSKRCIYICLCSALQVEDRFMLLKWRAVNQNWLLSQHLIRSTHTHTHAVAQHCSEHHKPQRLIIKPPTPDQPD